MQLFVQGSELHALQLSEEGVTVGDLKSQLAVLESASVEDLVLYCGGKPLENEFIVARYVSDSATLDLDLRIPGGMATYQIFYIKYFICIVWAAAVYLVII